MTNDILISDLKKVQNYFGENDKTTFEHSAYAIINEAINIISQPTPTDAAIKGYSRQQIEEAFNKGYDLGHAGGEQNEYHRIPCLQTYIGNLPTDSTSDATGWISVEDRLPETNDMFSERVLAFNGSDMKVVRLCKNSNMGILGYGTQGAGYMHGVTHYRALPVPPAPNP